MSGTRSEDIGRGGQTAHRSLDPARTVNFLGIAVEGVTYDRMAEQIDTWIANKDGRSHHIACLNAFTVVLALSNERLARIYNGADIAGADGMPFVRWIRWFRRVPCDRLYAPDIALELAERAKERGYSFYLYGAAPDVLAKMEENLRERFPHLRIVGSHSPPFRPLTEEEDEAICEEINRLKPDILLVGLGTPKQDYWIDEHLYRIRGSVMVASGATFDFFGGRVKMAPRLIQRSGFEWLYRLLSRDFLRLWRRYTVGNLIFLWNFALQICGVRVREPEIWAREE
jgi:N-acetylglucosaminyldiphosphoundecaprenol N-acetyl-beta-D-mannosaminyltransferase